MSPRHLKFSFRLSTAADDPFDNAHMPRIGSSQRHRRGPRGSGYAAGSGPVGLLRGAPMLASCGNRLGNAARSLAAPSSGPGRAVAPAPDPWAPAVPSAPARHTGVGGWLKPQPSEPVTGTCPLTLAEQLPSLASNMVTYSAKPPTSSSTRSASRPGASARGYRQIAGRQRLDRPSWTY